MRQGSGDGDGGDDEAAAAAGGGGFERLGLTEEVLAGLRESGFETPSPVQRETIPLGKHGFDVVAQAASGSGKTVAFCTVVLEMLQRRRRQRQRTPPGADGSGGHGRGDRGNGGPQALLVAPTRELAVQIWQCMLKIGRYVDDGNGETRKEGVSCHVCIGGIPIQRDIEALQQWDNSVVIGTPGRLAGLLHDRLLDLSAVRCLVLDEADQLLLTDVFVEDVAAIWSACGPSKDVEADRLQLLLYSATFTNALERQLARLAAGDAKFVKVLQNVDMVASPACDAGQGLHEDPSDDQLQEQQCEVREQVDAPDVPKLVEHTTVSGTTAPDAGVELQIMQYISQSSLLLSVDDLEVKWAALLRTLREEVFEHAIVFVNRSTTAGLLEERLRTQYRAAQFSSRLVQAERLRRYKEMAQGKYQVLICTDVASRGLDWANCDLIVNFDMPNAYTTYIHRLGRTARYGRTGRAISFVCTESHQKLLRCIEGRAMDIQLSSDNNANGSDSTSSCKAAMATGVPSGTHGCDDTDAGNCTQCELSGRSEFFVGTGAYDEQNDTEQRLELARAVAQAEHELFATIPSAIPKQALDEQTEDQIDHQPDEHLKDGVQESEQTEWERENLLYERWVSLA